MVQCSEHWIRNWEIQSQVPTESHKKLVDDEFALHLTCITASCYYVQVYASLSSLKERWDLEKRLDVHAMNF